MADAEISKLDQYHQPKFDPDAKQKVIERVPFSSKSNGFLAGEGAVAWVRMSRLDGRLVHGEGNGFRVGKPPKLPGLELAAEDYRRIARLAKTGEVTLELDSRVHYEDADHNAYNVIAEIPGSDPKAGYVMAGAHLGSWIAGDGAPHNRPAGSVWLGARR